MANSYASNHFPRSLSQAGQDFWIIGEVFNEKRSGYFVDIGAFDGVNISNTLLLERVYGWSGLCIEADPQSFSRLKELRAARCIQACVDSENGSVPFATRGLFGGIIDPATDNKPAQQNEGVLQLPARTLVSLLEEAAAPREIDYLSIDVEGAEERVLLNFPFESYLIRAMTIERPSDRLCARLASAGFIPIKEIPGLDVFYLHRSHIPTYQRNVFAFWAKLAQASGVATELLLSKIDGLK